jgi:hypothetical protein
MWRVVREPTHERRRQEAAQDHLVLVVGDEELVDAGHAVFYRLASPAA